MHLPLPSVRQNRSYANRTPVTELNCHQDFSCKVLTFDKRSTKVNASFRYFLEDLNEQVRMRYGSETSAYSKPMTSHALGGPTWSRRTPLHMQQRAASGYHSRHLETMTSYQKFDSSIDAYLGLLEEVINTPAPQVMIIIRQICVVISPHFVTLSKSPHCDTILLHFSHEAVIRSDTIMHGLLCSKASVKTASNRFSSSWMIVLIDNRASRLSGWRYSVIALSYRV